MSSGDAGFGALLCLIPSLWVPFLAMWVWTVPSAGLKFGWCGDRAQQLQCSPWMGQDFCLRARVMLLWDWWFGTMYPQAAGVCKWKYLSAVDKTQLFFFNYFYQKASKLTRHLVTFQGIENFPYFTLFAGWDDSLQNQCYGVNQISSPSLWLWNCSSFAYLSDWLEIQFAFTAKGEDWVPPEEIQLSGVFCFLWGDKILHLGSVKKNTGLISTLHFGFLLLELV